MSVTITLFGKDLRIDTAVPPAILQRYVSEVEHIFGRVRAGQPNAERVHQIAVVVLEIIERLYALERTAQQQRERLESLARRVDRLVARIEEEIAAAQRTVDTDEAHLVQ